MSSVGSGAHGEVARILGLSMRCVAASQDRALAEQCSAFAWCEIVILGMHVLLDVIKTMTHAFARV